jgi:hypothetical protein
MNLGFFLSWFFLSEIFFGCCCINSHQMETGDSEAGTELLDIILTKVRLSVLLFCGCVCVCAVMLLVFPFLLCSICGLFTYFRCYFFFIFLNSRLA